METVLHGIAGRELSSSFKLQGMTVYELINDSDKFQSFDMVDETLVKATWHDKGAEFSQNLE